MTSSLEAVTTQSALLASDLTIAYVGGGSRDWAPTVIQDLALSELAGTVRLYDTDRAAAERNARFGNWVGDRDAAAPWEYHAVDALEDALAGADAVVLSTQYDPAETFVHDLDLPAEYGIHGAVGATIGPGGIFRAMRTIPVYRRFASAIREHCPDAWVCCFTNPVHFLTRALYDEYPDVNALGLCHEVQHARDYLAELATDHLGMDVTRGDVSVNVKGINHFTWVDDVRCDGVDCWPLLEELATREAANRRYTPDELEDASPFVDNQQVTWELFRQYGLFPAAGDRHLVEYATAFLADGVEGLNYWGVKRTGSDYRAKHWSPSESDQTTDVEAWMRGERSFTLTRSDESLTDVLAALCGGERFVTNVNLPNRGQVAGLEHGAVVETNGLVGAGEVRPLAAGGFPRPLRSLVSDHVDTIETVIDASRDGDLDAAFRGFLTDPQVETLDPDDARDLFGAMVAAEADYLEPWNLSEASVLEDATTW
jgi:alpha-galactosidase